MTRSLRAMAVAAVLALTAGCGGADLSSGEQGFVSANGLITTLAPEDRRALADDVTGETLDGEQVALADLRGQVVVVNVWGSWCPPCRKEAPALVAAAEELAHRDVVFLGINVRDASKEKARAFERTYEVPYDSLYDPSGSLLLAFRGTIPPHAIPSTLVIDREGRIAAGKLDEITTSTLVGLVEDVLDGRTRSAARG
ncbi:MAG: TlpA disulfide reductase family protein [Nocardioides sp.]|nr:TlpA disulfide reductase family protein [Nocardioides sp.]